MTRYVDLVDATLAHGTMPAVVPQLKSITLGGAVAGVGIEATSFRQGLVHDAVVALDVLTGDGRIVTCTADNEHRDLFFGFPNSYGTLGYALAVTTRTLPVQPFVHVEHVRYDDADALFADVARHCAAGELDFLDGVAFAPDEMVLSLGRFADAAPYASDYTFERIYYRSLRERREDYLATRDYLWRWDTDWFWCSKNVGAQHPLLRRLYGRERLNSITYQRIMRWNSRVGLARAWNRLPRHQLRVGDPGRRHPDRARGRVPRVPARRRRHPADLDLPDPRRAAGPALSAVPAAAGRRPRQLRLLGHSSRPANGGRRASSTARSSARSASSAA